MDQVQIASSEHTARPWRIHELTPDFRVEDVWALPTPGGPEDFGRLVAQIAASDPARSSSPIAGAMWSIRWKIGALLGWDTDAAGVGGRVRSLRERLPADLRERPGPVFARLPFRSLYLLDREWAAEIANRTVHGVMHVGWVPDPAGGYRGQMAVLVKPNGRLGSAYLAAIKPIRVLVVYPALMRRMDRRWQRSGGGSGPESAQRRP